MSTEAADESDRSRDLADLAWLVAMGADEAVGDEALDRFARPAAATLPPKPQAPLPPARPLTGASPAFGDEAVAGAQALAARCTSLEDIAHALARFDACPLKRTATNLCYTDGNPRARVLFIGEAPGREEDLAGKPFVGRSGQLLDRMLAAIGLDRRADDPERSVLITNVIFWRPPGNRKPTEAETLMCLPFVARTVEVMAPRLIVCLGATPAQRLLATTEGILRLRGRWRSFAAGGREIALMPTLHPAYLLRQPAQKRLAWRDFLEVKKRLEATG